MPRRASGWASIGRTSSRASRPTIVPSPGATGMAAIAGDNPFIMKPDGVAWLFAPSGVKDGPLPTHYEPLESPVSNLLYPGHMCTPGVRIFPGPLNRLAPTPETEFPVVATTYRLTEHYLSGPMSRFNSWLNELQPEMFVELSPELAAERGIVHGGWVTVSSARGRIEVRAMVTRRMRPLVVNGRVVHQVGLPFHWGFAGQVVGGNANDLTSLVAEQNVSMHEGKSFGCQVEPGRRSGRTLRPTVSFVTWPTRTHSRYACLGPAGRDLHSWALESSSWRSCHRPATRPSGRSPRSSIASPGRSATVMFEPQPSTGFYTDTTVCIGCKSCEVACKQWNQLAADGLRVDRQQLRQHGGALGHVLAARQVHRAVRREWTAHGPRHDRSAATSHELTLDQLLPPAETNHELTIDRLVNGGGAGRWLMMSDVCKHCVAAPCQHACPTGAIIYNEFENVYIQPDICNGCSYCIAACPFGVITRSDFDGHAHKCTLCYDRQKDGLVPACGGLPDPVDPVRPGGRAARAGAEAGKELHRRGASRSVPVRRRPHRDLLRAEFVLPPCRSSCRVWPAGEAIQPVAPHARGLRPPHREALTTIVVFLTVFFLLGHSDA